MPIRSADEERLAAEMARELQGLGTAAGVHMSDGFADRVMAAVAVQPLPQPVRAFGVALVAGHLRSAAAAVGDAWRVVASGAVPVGVRAQALALVLVVAVGGLTIAGGATVGAIGLFGPDQATPSPSLVVPAPSPSPSVAPSPSIDPSPSPSATTEPSASVEPSETASPTSTGTAPSRTAAPSPTGTDDHGSGSGSGSGSSGSTQTPEPAETLKPGETPRTPDPIDTPEPTGTADAPTDS